MSKSDLVPVVPPAELTAGPVTVVETEPNGQEVVFESLNTVLNVTQQAYQDYVQGQTDPIVVPEDLRGWGMREARRNYLERRQQEREEVYKTTAPVRAMMGAIEVYAGNYQEASALVTGIGPEHDEAYQFALLRRGNKGSLRYIFDSLPKSEGNESEHTLLALARVGNLAAIDIASKSLIAKQPYRLVRACLEAGIPSKAYDVLNAVGQREPSSPEDALQVEWDWLLCALPFLTVDLPDRSNNQAAALASITSQLVGNRKHVHKYAQEDKHGDYIAQEEQKWRIKRLRVVEVLESCGYTDFEPLKAAAAQDRKDMPVSFKKDLDYYEAALELGGKVTAEYLAAYLELSSWSREYGVTAQVIKGLARGGEFELASSFIGSLETPKEKIEVSLFILQTAFDQGYQFSGQETLAAPPRVLANKLAGKVVVRNQYENESDDALFTKIEALAEIATLDESSGLRQAEEMLGGIANPAARRKAKEIIDARRDHLLEIAIN